MKKLLASLTAVCLISACTVSLGGCNTNDNTENNNAPECTHTAATYKGDANSHWKECGDCGEKFGETPHASYDAENRKDNAICPVCNYKFYTFGLSYGLGITDAAIVYSKYVTDTEIYIPDTLHGMTVTGIFGAFEGYENITSVRIPDTVTDIGYNAFKNCKSLKEITLPEGLIHLGTEAFAGCTSLESVTVPKNVEDILNAFKGCTNLKRITIQCSADRIYYDAFNGCESLEEIVIPDDVKVINDNAFKDCKTLKEIALPEGVEFLGKDVFAGCVSLEKIKLPESLNDIRPRTFEGCDKLIFNENANGYYLGSEANPYLMLMKVMDVTAAEFTINENCKFIYDGAFKGCANLESIVIHENVLSIGVGAFEGCSALTYVTVEDAKWWSPLIGNGFSDPREMDLRNPEKAATYLKESLTCWWYHTVN
ncbi:MAG: leucine-rich repeat domain-containing protein [Clostridia bacterium]|nr:leucine-rich repeat domain-containing protein [Clostridia bacterium]